MLGYVNVFIFISLQSILVQCLIPNLTVKRVDNKAIQRKRMDTLEMCRIFENERHKLSARKNDNLKTRAHARPKREAAVPKFGGIPTLREEDVRKVENIVDKLYDDLAENGQRVTYRQRELTTTTPTPEPRLNEELFNHSGRRFDFAPRFLLGPEPPSPAHSPPETVPVPWIKKWRHAIIPYFIDPKTYDNGLAEVIMAAFDYFERATCIRLQRLREKPQDRRSMEKVEWVYISNPTGIRQCVHSNERIPNIGVQMVVFGYDCMSKGEIVHEVMHILGYSHEHTRPDRDEHVAIVWDNIKPGYKKYFELRKVDTLMRLPYDYTSVLHYPARAFSKNGQITISAKSGVKVGQREGLSETDVEKVALIFSNECVDRNKEYLLTTCPSVVKTKPKTKIATQHEIQHYFKSRIWPYGIVNYKLRDEREFSAEERENIRAVFKHIEKETCIEFRNMAEDQEDFKEDDEEDDSNEKDDDKEDKMNSNRTVNSNTTEKASKLNEEAAPENVENTIPAGSKEILLETSETNATPTETVTDAPTEAVAAETVQTEAVSPGPEADAKVVSLEVDQAKEEVPKVPNRRTMTNKSKTKKRVKRGVPLRASRRHAATALVLTRSTEPGCHCPPPGKPEGAEATIELNADCFNSVNDLLHVFVHILGLDHQHNMHDRDDFLHIIWDKLTPEVRKEMQQKLPPAAAAGFPYDYQSVMHYPWLQIKDGVTNIMYPIWNDGWAMGHWQGLSATDVHKLSLLYFEQCLERKKHDESEQAEAGKKQG